MGFYDESSRNMENVETAMPPGQRVGGGKPFGFIDHIRKITDLNLEPAAGPIRLKLRPQSE